MTSASNSPARPSVNQALTPSTLGQINLGHQCATGETGCYYCRFGKTPEDSLAFPPLLPLKDARTLLESFPAHGLNRVTFCGGDPLEHPDLIPLLTYATSHLNLKTRISTLGHRLHSEGASPFISRSLNELTSAGLTELELLLDFSDPQSYQTFVGESLPRVEEVLQHLKLSSIPFSSSTLVTRHNLDELPEIARLLTKYPASLHTFRVQTSRRSQNRAGGPLGDLPSYALLNPKMNQAIEILEDTNVAVNVHGLPLCAAAGFEKNLVSTIGRFYDPHSPRNEPAASSRFPTLQLPPFTPGWIEPHAALIPHHSQLSDRHTLVGLRGKRQVFIDPCQTCHAQQACDGLSLDHLAEGPPTGLHPSPNFEVAPFHRDRHLYEPAFITRSAPLEEMGPLLTRAFERYRRRAPMPHTPQPPRVSVVITCYNYGRYLTQCLTSVARQTFDSFEMIIINDGSTDNSKEVAEAFIRAHPSTPVRLINQENFGQPAQPRNVGIDTSRGEYILCLDADDMIAPSMLEECVRELDANPSLGILYTDRLDFDRHPGYIQLPDYQLERLKYFNFLNCCSLFRREMWEATGGYRLNIRGCEDWDFWLAGGSRGFLGKRLPRPLFRYRNNDEGVFQESVLPELGQKSCQLILNNEELFAPHEIERARHFIKAPSTPTPRVTVVVNHDPTTGGPEALLDHVLEQTHPNLELVVSVSDPEEKASLESQFGNRTQLTVLPRPPDASSVSCLNNGLHAATGDYVTFIDDRGRFYPTFVEAALTRLARFPAATGLFSPVKHLRDFSAQASAPNSSGEGTLGAYSRPDLLVIPESPLMTCIHRTDLGHLLGGFDPTLAPLEHWDYLIRLSCLGLLLTSPTLAGEFIDGPPYPLTHPHFIERYQAICDAHRAHASADLVELQTKAMARFRQGLTILPRPPEMTPPVPRSA